MTSNQPMNLDLIVSRLEQGNLTADDIACLRLWLTSSDNSGQIQLGKYVVNIEKVLGQVHIGDRLTLTDEQIQTIAQSIQEKVALHLTSATAELPTIDDFVQKWRSHHPDDIQRLHDTMPLLSEELKQLERDLLVKKWFQANLRTRSIMLKTVQREKEQWLTEEQIHEFPDQVLQVVDCLWAQASDGKLGFKQQLTILEFNNQMPQAFGNHVGWFAEGAWLKKDSQLSLDLETMPAGHLPWNALPMITMDNAFLNGFVIGLRSINKQFIQRDWQRQFIADFMAGAGWLIRNQVDKEEFKRSLEYELSQNEPWWEGDRVEELKVKRLFALLLSHTGYLQ